MKIRFSDIMPAAFTPAGRTLNFVASVPVALLAVATALVSHILKISGWSVIGVSAVAVVILLASGVFVVVCLAAIVAALVIGLWKLSARVLEFARLFLKWAAV